MVKGISRQVILVESPDRRLFDQAIFILRDDVKNVTQEALLKEAGMILRQRQGSRSKNSKLSYWLCGLTGALVSALVMLLFWLA